MVIEDGQEKTRKQVKSRTGRRTRMKTERRLEGDVAGVTEEVPEVDLGDAEQDVEVNEANDEQDEENQDDFSLDNYHKINIRRLS